MTHSHPLLKVINLLVDSILLGNIVNQEDRQLTHLNIEACLKPHGGPGLCDIPGNNPTIESGDLILLNFGKVYIGKMPPYPCPPPTPTINYLSQFREPHKLLSLFRHRPVILRNIPNQLLRLLAAEVHVINVQDELLVA